MDGGWLVLEGERLGEERFDRLGRRRTEPGEQALATAALAEQAGVELEGRQKVDLRQQLVQAPYASAKGGAVARRLQTLVEAGATPIVGELEQRLLGQAEQRAAQHGGEAQVVLGQQQHVAERDQVHDRDVIGQRQPVGAGDRHVQLLELADQQLLQDAAPRQEDHDVAGADRLAGGRQRRARRAARRRSGGRSPGQGGSPRARWSHARSGSCQPPALMAGSTSISGQTSTRPGARGPEAFVRRPAVPAHHAVARLGIGKNRVDQIEDRLGRTERPAERLFAPRLPAEARPRLECAGGTGDSSPRRRPARS